MTPDRREHTPEASRAGPFRGLAGASVVVVVLVYTGFLHHGIGPAVSVEPEWWEPRGFLIASGWLGSLETRPWLAAVLCAAPAAVAAATGFALLASSLARTLALTAVLACWLFTLYGLRPPGPRIWEFFHWRGSGVMIGLAASVAAALAAPLLARSWLRLPASARAAVYLPFLFGVVWVVRHTTGTDETLRFAISPWPVVPFFGIQLGVVVVVAVWVGIAAVLAGFAERERHPGLPVVGAFAGLALPVLWLGLVMVQEIPRVEWVACIAVALGAAGWLAVGGLEPDGLRRRTRFVATGAVLAALPPLLGTWIAERDYHHNRDVLARGMIEALDRYYARETVYPDSLEELLQTGDLASVPEPGFGPTPLSDERFSYQSFGTSYLLEFSAGAWVQCQYNPPWEEEFDEDEADETNGNGETDGPGGETLDDSWSCPSNPPELW